MHERGTLQRVSPLAITLILALIPLLVEAPHHVAANPLPDGLILVHVQPANPGFCAANTITSCSEITQYSELSGIVEFDLYLYPVFFEPPTLVCSLQTAVEWPASWSFLDWQPCQGGQDIIELTETSAVIHVVYPDCPEATDEVFLLGRFLMDVEGYGSFGAHSFYDTVVELIHPPDGSYEMHPFLTTGEAGVECAYCWTDCDFVELCRPDPAIEVLDLEVPLGETTQEQIEVFLHGGLMHPCSADFLPTEDWMQLDVAPGGDGLPWVVTLTVDTSELAMGSYSGWIRMESDCVGCTKINLEVGSPVTGVPDVRHLLNTNGLAKASTWGLLKSLYR